MSGYFTHTARFSTKWRKRWASSGFVRGQAGIGGSTTEDIIIKRSRSRSGGDEEGWRGAAPADSDGVRLEDTGDLAVGEAQAVSNSSGPLSGLEASSMVA